MTDDYIGEKFALNLAEDGRILSSTYERFAGLDGVLVDSLPEGDILDYIYNPDGTYTYDPIPKVIVDESSTAQADTDAMLVDHEYRLTLLELGLTE